MVGTWSGQLKSTVRGTLRLLPVEEGRIEGFVCVTYADGSTLAWSFSPEDEPGVVAQVKFGVLQIRQHKRTYTFEIPKPGQDRIRYRARRDGEPYLFAKGRLRRTERTTCADRLLSRADADLEPVPEDEDNPLIGEWSGLWGNGVIDEIQITEIGSWGVTRGVFCELVSNGTAFRFWDLDDRRIGARRTRKGDKPTVAWTRKPARWALRYEKRYRFEVVRVHYGKSWAVQSWRYGAKKRERLTMVPRKLPRARMPGEDSALGRFGRVRSGPGEYRRGGSRTLRRWGAAAASCWQHPTRHGATSHARCAAERGTQGR